MRMQSERRCDIIRAIERLRQAAGIDRSRQTPAIVRPIDRCLLPNTAESAAAASCTPLPDRLPRQASREREPSHPAH